MPRKPIKLALIIFRLRISGSARSARFKMTSESIVLYNFIHMDVGCMGRGGATLLEGGHNQAYMTMICSLLPSTCGPDIPPRCLKCLEVGTHPI